MNYSDILHELEVASAFDLYRLQSAIGRKLEEPQRILEAKASLRPGQKIEYFLAEENRTIAATVLEMKRTRVNVCHDEDGRRWSIPYYYINLQSVDTGVSGATNKSGLDRNEVKVGDRVGFSDQNKVEHFGQVVRLNPKTVTLEVEGDKWRVSYALLFKVLAPAVDCLASEAVINTIAGDAGDAGDDRKDLQRDLDLG